ncbi:N-acetylglucosamine-6-phosphate deacetylase [Novosphingobium sp. 1949]|uniref:N-acetylglucosamine-6-phosphate deacetylase n=1 Tax=Novosphingobium organovorum TaxID=2930092 RepID=A0ABT0BIX4_9SPHN|nr:N-acetylglucosamine-6-phosphate deacetylase [Novosphingobium organovorum]MCJ2184969.1 N-acetylglucosamine-6-phosphate deacetylase [Novosphingobium organovorum]
MSRITFENGQVLVDGVWRDGATLACAGGRIAAITPADGTGESVDLRGGRLVPGLIDIQVNGGGGVLLNETPTREGIATMARAHAGRGTTGILPTLISGSTEMIARALDAGDEAIAAGVPGCLGVHVEGPVLSRRYKGIHAEERLCALDDAMMELLLRPRQGKVVFTIAPEYLDPEQAAALRAAGVILSIGHSSASYETARDAFAFGATGVTHLYNAMLGLHHREPGMVGAALENQEAWCGLIVDGHHVHPAALRIALAARPLDRFMLVSDAMPCVGMDSDHFMLDGRRITVAGGRCIDDAGTLAGASLDLAQAVQNSVEMVGLPIETALAMASANPAAFLGMGDRRGRLANGFAADLTWLGRDGAPHGAWIAGERIA